MYCVVWLTAFFTEKGIGYNSRMIIFKRSPRLMLSPLNPIEVFSIELNLFPAADTGRFPTFHTGKGT
jgi:hypothetical protein